jgi:uncharacterized protein (DUF169 family)
MSEEAQRVAELGRTLMSAVGLSRPPVGVRLLGKDRPVPATATVLVRHRYCQAVMRARHGEEVALDSAGINCPAAAAAFGFRPLTDNLASGRALVGFGIVSDPDTGRRMFHEMPRLEPNSVGALHLFPLDRARAVPDVVVIEDEVEKLMWIALAALRVSGGRRVTSSTAVLQAMCVDSTVIPYLERRTNLGFGCYGCREATDIGPGDAALGFPGSDLSEIVLNLEALGERAIAASRSKRALARLEAVSDISYGNGE